MKIRKISFYLTNNLRYCLLVSIAFSATSSCCFADPAVTNPILDFVTQHPVTSDNKLLELQTDLNHDGEKQILLSRTYDTDSSEGNIWTVYLPKPDGTYVKVDRLSDGDTIEFRRDCYFVGKIAGVNNDVIAAYFHGGDESGSLVVYQIINYSVKVVIGKEIHPFGIDKPLFDKLFGGTPAPAVREIDLPNK